MNHLLVSITYVVGVGELALGLYFWKTNSNNEIRRVMAFLALVTGLWVIANAASAYTLENSLTVFADKATFALGAFILTALFHFALVFPYPMRRLDTLHYIFFYLPAVAITWVMMNNNTLIAASDFSPTQQGTWTGGPLYSLYNFYLFSLFVSTFLLLLQRYKHTDGIHRRNVLLVVYSILLGGLPAVILGIFLPLLNNSGQFPLVGPVSTVIWLGFTSYIILKK